MFRNSNRSLIVALAIIGSLAFACIEKANAQTAGVVTATASPSRGTASVTPTITWSSSPVAIGCAISNGSTLVSGLGASGSRAMPAITSTADYTVTCTWSGGAGSALVSWTAPTANTDGSSLTDLASFKVFFGGAPSALSQSMNIANPAATSATVSSLANGTWYFAVRAVNAAGVESDNSANVPSKVIAVSAVSASKTVTVTVDKKPNPPGNVTVTEPIAYNVRPDLQRFAFYRGSRAGSVRLGAACDASRTTADGYNVISRLSQVSPRPAQGSVLVARCG